MTKSCNGERPSSAKFRSTHSRCSHSYRLTSFCTFCVFLRLHQKVPTGENKKPLFFPTIVRVYFLGRLAPYPADSQNRVYPSQFGSFFFFQPFGLNALHAFLRLSAGFTDRLLCFGNSLVDQGVVGRRIKMAGGGFSASFPCKYVLYPAGLFCPLESRYPNEFRFATVCV